jgi:hypothetical protein
MLLLQSIEMQRSTGLGHQILEELRSQKHGSKEGWMQQQRWRQDQQIGGKDGVEGWHQRHQENWRLQEQEEVQEKQAKQTEQRKAVGQNVMRKDGRCAEEIRETCCQQRWQGQEQGKQGPK